MSQILQHDFFPQGVALGDNFCDRIQLQKRLKDNIKMVRPTLITSPRRYGKTSLVLHVAEQLKLPFSFIDLYAEFDETGVQNTILNSIGDALYALESVPKKALQFVADFFSDLSVSFNIREARVKVEFARSAHAPAQVLLDALRKLEMTLQKKKKKAILFFDEFQKLPKISESTAIEGALRHIAQQAQHIGFIFSGSNRHLLHRIFDDRTRPFYKLCDRLILERITAEHYTPFIQEKARIRWKQNVCDDVVNRILDVTHRHPYYVNALCHRLWLSKKAPTVATATEMWRQYATEMKSDVLGELALLSNNQTKMLIGIAKYGTHAAPTSRSFISQTHFSLSSASQALKSLEKLDYVYVNGEGKYRILDPLIEYIFMQEV